MKKARIRFSTEILRRLGEELNPSVDQSILELVKNAYDADAKRCEIDILEKPNGRTDITISDDGDGMSVQQIENGFLILGTSSKVKTASTRLGRTPAGSKGLGRLAALRMGRSVELLSRSKRKPAKQHLLKIDWSKFDQATIVDAVPLEIVSKRSTPSEWSTVLRLQDVETPLKRADVKRLARSLVLLADPFGDEESGFRPTINSPEYADVAKLVSTKYFRDAEYHLSAVVDAGGHATAMTLDWRGEELFRADHDTIANKRKSRKYDCPPATFDLWIFVLNKETFSTRASSMGEVQTWLEQFGGVHLYENRLRVGPYGNPGNDWLDLNLRRVRSPEERPSTNNSIGRVSLADVTGVLTQKTDRSGYIESQEFSELRNFAVDSLEWLARRRLELATKRRLRERQAAKKATLVEKVSVEKALEKIPHSARKPVVAAFESYNKSREKEVKGLRKEIQLYRTLSTAGITAATFAHEATGNPIKVIAYSNNSIETRSKKLLDDAIYTAKIAPPVETIRAAVTSLEVFGKATLRLLEHEKRRTGRINLHDVILGLLQTLKPFSDGRDVKIDTAFADKNPYFKGSIASVESIFANLINNSLTAFEVSGAKNRRILIATSIDKDEAVNIRVSDNGPGLAGLSLDEVWIPGQTTRPGGTGLGLSIVRDAVTDMEGGVEAIAKGGLGGFEISIVLPILGATS